MVPYETWNHAQRAHSFSKTTGTVSVADMGKKRKDGARFYDASTIYGHKTDDDENGQGASGKKKIP